MGFYSTNNAKFRVYNTTRRLEQKYNDEQQDGLDELLAEQRGEVDMATRYARVAKSVINAVGDQIQQPKVPGTAPKATDYLNELIQTGRLSEAFDKIKKMNLEGLSTAAQDIVKNIQNPQIRKSIVSDFNNKVEQIMIKNATPEQKADLIQKGFAEADTLRKISKNPGLAEMAAARARQLAETRDVAALDMLRANRPKNDALLQEVLKTRAGLRKTPVNTPVSSAPGSPKPAEELKKAFAEAIGTDVDTANQILGKLPSPTASQAPTLGMTEDFEDDRDTLNPKGYAETKTDEMLAEIKSLNAQKKLFSNDEIAKFEKMVKSPGVKPKNAGGKTNKALISEARDKIQAYNPKPTIRANASSFTPAATI